MKKLAYEDKFFFKDKKEINNIVVNEIITIEAVGNYVRIYGKTKRIVIPKTLKSILEKFPEEFFQVHKSHIVNSKYVDYITKNEIIIGKYKVPLSRRKRTEFFKFLDT